MEAGRLVELVAMRTLLQKARLAEEAKHTVLWCLDQLPALYADFRRNYESRFGDGILRLARAILKRLSEGEPGEDADRVARALVSKLARLHVRLGLPPMVLQIAIPLARARAGKPA